MRAAFPRSAAGSRPAQRGRESSVFGSMTARVARHGRDHKPIIHARHERYYCYRISMMRLQSRGVTDLVGLRVDHRISVDVIEVSKDGDVSPNPGKFRRRQTGSADKAATVYKHNEISDILRWVSTWPDRPQKRRSSRKRCSVSRARWHQRPASSWAATANFPEKAACRCSGAQGQVERHPDAKVEAQTNAGRQKT